MVVEDIHKTGTVVGMGQISPVENASKRKHQKAKYCK
jgi:hypothetical protein